MASFTLAKANGGSCDAGGIVVSVESFLLVFDRSS